MSSGNVFRLVLAAVFTICMIVMLAATLRFRRSTQQPNSPARKSTLFLVLSSVGVLTGLAQVLLVLLV